MSDTETRPTPEEIVARRLATPSLEGSIRISYDSDVQGMPGREAGWLARKAVRALEADGYRIVRPDDVPELTPEGWDGLCADPEVLVRSGTAHGWNACRAHIFGGDDE